MQHAAGCVGRVGVTIRKWSDSDNALDKSSVWLADDICVGEMLMGKR